MTNRKQPSEQETNSMSSNRTGSSLNTPKPGYSSTEQTSNFKAGTNLSNVKGDSTSATATQYGNRQGQSQTSSLNSISNNSSSIGSKKGTKTKIVVKYDVGFSNSLFIRGNGAGLSWTKGIPLKNIKADEWVWESDSPFATAEFKVLINDIKYEEGANRLLTCGTTFQYIPRFS